MAHAFATLNDDQELLDEIFATLSRSVNPLANPSGSDGTYAAAIGPLPKGLRAMAATHHLDISADGSDQRDHGDADRLCIGEVSVCRKQAIQ